MRFELRAAPPRLDCQGEDFARAGDVVERRFLSLAKALSCEAKIEYYLPNGDAQISGVGD